MVNNNDDRGMTENQYALMQYFVAQWPNLSLADMCEALERAYELGRFEGNEVFNERPTLDNLAPVADL